MKIAFFGLGTMGAPMARRLSAQHQVAAWDISVDARAAFADIVADDANTCLEGADIVISMLPEGRHVAELYRQTVLPNAARSANLIDCSTIDVQTAMDLADEAGSHGLGMLDAPVSGGAEGAIAGTLSFMVGGPHDAYADAQPVLSVMGSKISHFGPAGAGQSAKACHNLICGVTALGVCEAFALADALGLDTEQFFQLCQGAAAQSWILENRCPVPGPAPDAPASNNYAPGFAARLMAKDLRLSQSAAEASGQPTPMAAQAASKFTEFANSGAGDLDFSAIYRTIRGECS